MKIIKPSYEIMQPLNREEILRHLEKVGRVCYKSEGNTTPDSAGKFVQGLIKRGHESIIEHYSFSVRFIVDRGISHEIVRHRLASYAQESTRYCNYGQDKFGNEITVIEPLFHEGTNYSTWMNLCNEAETRYFDLLSYGATPEQARSVLPTSLKTELIMTANLREWRHFLKLRTSRAAHPQMREVAVPLLEELKATLPEVFGDIGGKE